MHEDVKEMEELQELVELEDDDAVDDKHDAEST